VTMPSDPLALLRSRSYVALLVIAAIIGAPVSALAYFFLALVSKLQGWVFTDLPKGLGFHAEPLWWPLLPLAVAGVLVALTLKYLPGTGGHSPADGFKAGGGPASPIELPGIVLAAFATLSLGVVLGPEAPLIAIGGGLGVIAVRLVRRDAPARTQTVVAAAGSFAAIATLLGSPLTGAFLLMEATGLGGAMMELVLIPGLLAAGIGSLVFIGLDAWTGLGTFSLAIPGLPHFGSPTFAEFGWALAIGVLAVPLGSAIRWLGLFLRPYSERRILVITPLMGLAVAGLAIAFAAATGKGSGEVLFSGQSDLGPFLSHSASYTIGALLLLLACKGLAYGISLSSFRGGPTFPALFLGGVGGVALSHLPGLPLVAGVAMGIGAMSVVMLRLPLTSVLLATLLLASDGLAVMPLVIVSVVVAYVLSARLAPAPAQSGDPAPATPGHPEPQPAGSAATPGASGSHPA
jgi:H+/Cl- antiporter ClcA